MDQQLAKLERKPADEPAGFNFADETGDILVSLPVESIEASGQHLRFEYDNGKADEELAKSFQEFDILEPLIVERTGVGKYLVLCGHRRLQAAKSIGKGKVPCLVKRREFSDEERIVIMLIEDLQKKHLSPLELAEAYTKLQGLGLSQNEIACRVGKSKFHVNKALAFYSRLTAEERAEIKKVATSQHFDFARLEEGSQIDDPDLRHRALFTDMPIREIRRLRKQQNAEEIPKQPKKISYEAQLKDGALRASLKIMGRPMTREEVCSVANQLAERLCEEHHL